jgi:hypothetical protein
MASVRSGDASAVRFCGEKAHSTWLECAPEGGESNRMGGEMQRPLPSQNLVTNVCGVHGLWLWNWMLRWRFSSD